jgi:hypothetical protein
LGGTYKKQEVNTPSTGTPEIVLIS